MKAIGDNLIIVARSPRYSASQFRDLFLWAIGDKDTPPKGCEEAAEFIAADQRGMEERLAKRKAAKAERQARWKANRDARDAEDAEDAIDGGDAGDGHQPTIPSIPSMPANNNSPSFAGVGACACARGKPPTLKAVLAFAGDETTKPDGKTIPADFAREWFALMEAATPPWTNTRGRSVAVNWKQELIYAFDRKERFAAENAKRRKHGNTNQPSGVIHDEENYENPFEQH